MLHTKMFEALDARNNAQASHSDKWIPLPWCEIGTVQGDMETCYTLRRMDPRLAGRAFGFDDAEWDGTLIICRQSYDGKWEFSLSGTPRNGEIKRRYYCANLSSEVPPQVVD